MGAQPLSGTGAGAHPTPDPHDPLLFAPRTPAWDPGHRRSRLFPQGTLLAHADLHNHTLLSDGVGQPEQVFSALRAAGLDVAALTDHAKFGLGHYSRYNPAESLPPAPGRPGMRKDPVRVAVGLNESGWERAGRLADAADDPGAFAALRGFEWSHPKLGHVNVWLSSRWTDVLHTSGLPWQVLSHEERQLPGIARLLGHVRHGRRGRAGMTAFYDWLCAQPTARAGGGLDALIGFNHPGRERGSFDRFRFDPRLVDRVVSMELFNKRDDFLFAPRGLLGRSEPESPLCVGLNAGWRCGLLGVTDEHGDDWGRPQGKGRAGLWVRELSRAGVREALLARRFFATNQRGLRLDASANGCRMGQPVLHRRGPVAFALDLDRHVEWDGVPLQVQVLRPGARVPAVAHVEPFVTGTGVVRFTVDLDRDDGDWVVLRVADPSQRNARPGPADHPGNLRGLAYASPFWLDSPA